MSRSVGLPLFVLEVTVQNFRFLFLVQELASAAVSEGIEVIVVVAAAPLFVADVIGAGITPLVKHSCCFLACVEESIDSCFLFLAGAAHVVGFELGGVVFTASPEVGSVPIASSVVAIGDTIVSVLADFFLFDDRLGLRCWLWHWLGLRCFNWSLAHEYLV